MSSTTSDQPESLLTSVLPNPQTPTPVQAWIVEFDMEGGRVQHTGAAHITLHPGQGTPAFVESHITGGCYDEVFIRGRLELRTAESHYLAVFSTEDAMRAGAVQIVAQFGDELPHGVHRILTQL